MQVVAGVGVASDDRAEITGTLSPEPDWIDQLEPAIAGLESVEVVDVAVYEHGVGVVGGRGGDSPRNQRVLDGRFEHA